MFSLTKVQLSSHHYGPNACPQTLQWLVPEASPLVTAKLWKDVICPINENPQRNKERYSHWWSSTAIPMGHIFCIILLKDLWAPEEEAGSSRFVLQFSERWVLSREKHQLDEEIEGLRVAAVFLLKRKMREEWWRFNNLCSMDTEQEMDSNYRLKQDKEGLLLCQPWLFQWLNCRGIYRVSNMGYDG